MIRIELLSTENFKLDSLDNYQRKHDVKRVYRKHNGEYVLVDCVYTEDWDLEGDCLMQERKKPERPEQRLCIFQHAHLKKLLLFMKLWEPN